jgi:surfeit locus 1 family protein
LEASVVIFDSLGPDRFELKAKARPDYLLFPKSRFFNDLRVPIGARPCSVLSSPHDTTVSRRMTSRARGYLFFGITVLLAAIFVRLGIWQLSRLGERRTHNRAALAARELPPVTLNDSGAPSYSALANRRISATGQYDLGSEVVLRGQTEGGVAGVRIVTPLRLAGRDTAVLVQRGFVPSPDAMTVDLGHLKEEGTVTVSGLATILPDSGVVGDARELNGQTSWRRVELAELRRRFSYPLAPLLLVQSPDSGLTTGPRRDEPPDLDDGPHLSYAVQWFAFATTALVVGVIIGFRKR